MPNLVACLARRLLYQIAPSAPRSEPAIDISMFYSLNIPDHNGKFGQAKAWRRALVPSCICLLFLIEFCTVAQGGEPTVEVFNQSNSPATSEPVVNLVRPFPQVEIYTQAHIGYDSNFQTSHVAVGSWFTDEQVSLSYQLPSRDMHLSLVTGVGLTNYFGNRTDENAFFDLDFSQALTRRLTLSASLNASYGSEPTLTANVGPNQFRGNYFTTTDRIWANYELTRRWSTVTSFNLLLVRYQNPLTAASTDREEYTFGEQLRYDLSRVTVLTGEYRLLLIDYVTSPRNSATNFVLAGVEHRFDPRLNIRFQAGFSVRSLETGGNPQIDPSFEWSMNYLCSRYTSLGWTASYAAGASTESNATSTTTFRTGLQLNHAFTGRITSSLSVDFSHQENQQTPTTFGASPTFSEDTLNLSLNVRYRITRLLTLELGIQHSQVSSAAGLRDYSRNRCSIGASLAF